MINIIFKAFFKFLLFLEQILRFKLSNLHYEIFAPYPLLPKGKRVHSRPDNLLKVALTSSTTCMGLEPKTPVKKP